MAESMNTSSTDMQSEPAFVLKFAHQIQCEVHAGNGMLSHAGSLVRSLAGGVPKRAIIATDVNVRAVHGSILVASLADAGLQVLWLTIPAGEEQKTLANVVDALGRLARAGAERHDVLVALGGGVPGDLFGYVAASYMRGIRLVQVPTTLVAQVDSSIGGKVGVDLPEGKNLVGAFKHADRVIIDYTLLTTLPHDEWVAGTAEVAKHGVIADRDLFEWLEESAEGWRTHSVELGPILAAAIQVKARIVQEDERETGLRMHLNYGHTLGHALETVAGYRGLRHGEAVAWGMAMEARLASRVGLSNADFVRRQDRLLQSLGLLAPLTPLDADAVYERLFLDKKVKAGRIRWVLPGRQPGNVVVRDDLPEGVVRELIHATVEGRLLEAP
ncbi:MAG: 3-dehydroquinate synthase [Chloroflexi bacterium]|nr:3-dehydroquinate synthase [Chloroflexota bacterium]